MHMSRNCHRHLWLLSGTGDGTPLAEALLNRGWKVSVSVVTTQASLKYCHLTLESLWVGALSGVEDIQVVIENARLLHEGFEWIIDATHPFAEIISSNLKIVCNELDQPLMRFDRCVETFSEAFLIKSHLDLLNFDLAEKKILFAIGSRVLSEALDCGRRSGAIVFARVMPTVEGIRKALCCHLPSDHLAVVTPSRSNSLGQIEEALCMQWDITTVVARQSGGITQRLWQNIARKNGIDLFLIARPGLADDVCVANSYQELIDKL